MTTTPEQRRIIVQQALNLHGEAHISPEVLLDVFEYMDGVISADELVERTKRRYGIL